MEPPNSSCDLRRRHILLVFVSLLASTALAWRGASLASRRDPLRRDARSRGTNGAAVDGPPPLVHEGFEAAGACDLHGLRDAGEAVDLAVFVKHGFHSTRKIPRGCATTTVRPRRVWHQDNVTKFVRAGGDRKMLTVRGQASFYKSAFNHVCNKDAQLERTFRERHGVDCGRDGEFERLLTLPRGTTAMAVSPFVLKDVILRAREVRRVMFVDYACVPAVVNLLCGMPMMGIGDMTGKEGNSAAGQNYTDFWSARGYAPYAPFDPFWDRLYENLTATCCLEFVQDHNNSNAWS